MTSWLAAIAIALAGAGETAQLQAQAEDAAMAVAQARQSGARRTVVARLMREYRSAAEALATAEAPRATGVVPLEALQELTEAIATGRRGTAPRDALAAVVGEPVVRIPLLEAALQHAIDAEGDELRRSLLLDLAEHAGALALIAEWDAGEASTSRRRLELRATALTRVIPGQAGGVDRAVEAQRLREAARAATRQREQHTAYRDRARVLAQRATSALEDG